MTATHKNFLKTTISAVASAGLGALTISTASSGCRTFGAGDDGLTFDGITITEGAAWEVRDGCVYTHSGTSLSRGTLQDSSTGSAIAFTSAAIVEQNPAARFSDLTHLAMASVMPGGRLTLESGVPVSTTDQTAKTSVYYTPYVHNVVPLWDGYKWVPVEFSETTLALGTLTSGKPYDVFGYLSAGALVLESLVWTNDTTRATAVTLQDGRYCKSGDKTRLLLGTFYTTSTTTTEDSKTSRYLCNVYNVRSRLLQVTEATANWNYNTFTWRSANNNTSNRVRVLTSVPGPLLDLQVVQRAYGSATAIATWVSIGAGSTSAPSSNATLGARTGVEVLGMLASLKAASPVGAQYYQWLERGHGSGTSTFISDSAAFLFGSIDQ